MQVLPATLLFSLFLLIFPVMKHQKGIILSFFALLLVSFFVFTGGYSWLHTRLGNREENTPTKATPTAPFIEKRLHRLDNLLVYVDNRDQKTLSNLVTITPSSPYLTHHAEADFIPESFTLSVGEEKSIVVEPHNPLVGTAVTSPVLLRSFFEEVAFFNDQLVRQHETNRRQFRLLCFVFLFFTVSALFFSNLSAWKPFNLLLALFLFRASFALYSFGDSDFAREIGYTFSETIGDSFPILIVFICGCMFFILTLLRYVRKEG
jgi:hypothetical protein